jgi:hypothetical protein
VVPSWQLELLHYDSAVDAWVSDQLAAGADHDELLALLWEHRERVSVWCWLMFHAPITHGPLPELLEEAPLDEFDLEAVLRRSDIPAELRRRLLRQGGGAHAWDYSAIHLGDADLLELLLEAQCDAQLKVPDDPLYLILSDHDRPEQLRAEAALLLCSREMVETVPDLAELLAHPRIIERTLETITPANAARLLCDATDLELCRGLAGLLVEHLERPEIAEDTEALLLIRLLHGPDPRFGPAVVAGPLAPAAAWFACDAALDLGELTAALEMEAYVLTAVLRRLDFDRLGDLPVGVCASEGERWLLAAARDLPPAGGRLLLTLLSDWSGTYRELLDTVRTLSR